MTAPIINPKRPTSGGWRIVEWFVPESVPSSGEYPVEAYWLPARGLFVLSAVEVARDKHGPDLGPEYHISISRDGRRCSSADARIVLQAFGLEDATEDNHVPGGIVRNFWRPVADRLSGYECPCKDSEPAMVEDKGDFIWRGTPE